MTFWNGTAWAPETTPTPPRDRIGRAAALVATLIMTGSLALYVVPMANTTASGPTLTLSPTTGAPGTNVTVTGNGFSRRVQVQLTWDGASTGMPTVSTSRRGSLRTSFTVPKTTAGLHTSGAAQALSTSGARKVRRPTTGSTLATAVFNVIGIASPTTAPTARPTPTPVPTATPVPTPVPKAPAAGTSVPASIDATCATNVSPALNTWIAGRPNGSTLVFPSGSCYLLAGDAGINLANRTGLTLVGNGSTLQLRTTGASNFSSGFFLQDSDHIIIRGFTVDGGNTTTGTTAAVSGINERINGAVVRAGSDFVEFDHVSWDRLHGFGVILSDDGRPGDWPADVSIHNSVIRGGEMGVAVVAGRRVQIVHNSINDTVYTAIDLEPDQAQHGFQDVRIADNDVTRYSWGQNLTSWFVAACPSDSVLGTAVMDGLTITGNRVHTGAATANNGNYDGLGGLGIRADKSNLKRNVVITNNTTTDNDTQSASRGVIYLANVANLTVTGNRQPIANGAALVRDSGTSGTRVVSGNDVTP